MPEGVREGILRGMYRIRDGRGEGKLRVQLLGSGTILREVLAAAELLEADFQVAADVWSCTSLNELRRDGIDCERWNLLHPEEPPRQSWVERCLGSRSGPVVAATDYQRAYADQIRPYVAQRYKVLGTDGYRAQRHAPPAAVVLRGGSPLGGGRRAQGARGRRRASGRDGQQRDLPLRNRREEAESGDGVIGTASAGDPVASERQVLVPDIGDFHDVEVIEVLVAVGDTVAADQTLITLESDKATMEIPSPAAGVVRALSVRLGDKVSEGSPIATLEVAEAAKEPAPGEPAAAPAAEPPAAAPAPAAPAPPPPSPPSPLRSAPKPAWSRSEGGTAREGGADARVRAGVAAHASPSVRRLARELGVDLSQVTGSGRKHRVRTEDVQALRQVRARGGRDRLAAGPPGGAAAGHRLREVRRDRGAGAAADPPPLGPQPAPLLGHDSARHPVRRGRRHRPRGLPPLEVAGRRSTSAPSSRCSPSC